eukprot:4974257-Amphidinium_carterae.1
MVVCKPSCLKQFKHRAKVHEGWQPTVKGTTGKLVSATGTTTSSSDSGDWQHVVTPMTPLHEGSTPAIRLPWRSKGCTRALPPHLDLSVCQTSGAFS